MTSNGQNCCIRSKRNLGRIRQIASADGWLAVFHDPQPGNQRAVFTKHIAAWALVEDIDVVEDYSRDTTGRDAIDKDKHLDLVGMCIFPGEGYMTIPTAGNFMGYAHAESMREDLEAMFDLHEADAAVYALSDSAT